MKQVVFLFLFSFAVGFTYAQQNNGIRIGNGNSGKNFNPSVFTESPNQLEISTSDELITGVEIYDESNELIVASDLVSTDEASVDINGLQQGVYFVAIISESGQVQYNTFFKQ